MKRFLSVLLVVILLLSTLLSLCSCKRDYYVKMEVKDYGSVIIFLDGHNTPKTVKHFVKLVKSGYYDGLSFHRVMRNFMVQAGDGEPCDNVVGEFAQNGHQNNIPHEYGVISMARATPYNSASSEFFICNSRDRSTLEHLDGAYAAFGWVVEGMEVIDAITENTADYGEYVPPAKRAIIERITVINYNK
jgi:peptidyl-prolyl cis-trans isomerase B (cyclophilin B)